MWFFGSLTYGDRSGEALREFGMEVLSTYPSVIYEVRLTSGKVLSVENPVQLPDQA